MKIEIATNRNYSIVFEDYGKDSYNMIIGLPDTASSSTPGSGKSMRVITLVVSKEAIKRLARAS